MPLETETAPAATCTQVARPSSNRTNSTGCPRTSTVAFPNRFVRGALLVGEPQQAGGYNTARAWALYPE
jgi:hypothetical protein